MSEEKKTYKSVPDMQEDMMFYCFTCEHWLTDQDDDAEGICTKIIADDNPEARIVTSSLSPADLVTRFTFSCDKIKLFPISEEREFRLKCLLNAINADYSF